MHGHKFHISYASTTTITSVFDKVGEIVYVTSIKQQKNAYKSLAERLSVIVIT